jgi:hypothetical protein
MPNRKWTFIAALFIAALAFPLGSNADSIERANSEDIQMLLSAASGENSAYWATYIGETRDRVYIEYTTAIHVGSLFSNKPKYVVYWLARSELTEEQLKLFMAYKSKFVGNK